MTQKQFDQYNKPSHLIINSSVSTDNFYIPSEDTFYNNLDFICQFKMPNQNIWYSLYQDLNFDYNLPLEEWWKNGNRYTINKFLQKPDQFFKNVKYFDFQEHEDPLDCNSYTDITGEYEDYDNFLGYPNKEYYYMPKIEGYPTWMQDIEIPTGMTLDNFVGQISFEYSFKDKEFTEFNMKFGDGCIYLFDNGTDIKIVYQR
jgi:hypothetical protein